MSQQRQLFFYPFISLERLSQKVPVSHWPVSPPAMHFSHSFPLLLFPILSSLCGCSGCVMLLCRQHSTLTSSCVPSQNSTDTWEGKKEERRQKRVARWGHCPCDVMETLVALTQALHAHFQLKPYKHSAADVYRRLELTAEYNLRGYGLISSSYISGSSGYKHTQAEITKCLKWGSVIVVRMRGGWGGGGVHPAFCLLASCKKV